MLTAVLFVIMSVLAADGIFLDARMKRDLPGYEYVNAAKGGFVEQSSTSWDGNATRAVDGDTSGNYWSNSCTHTDKSPHIRNWWKLTLDQITPIGYVTIWNREDCCSDRIDGVEVFVDGVSCGKVSYVEGKRKYTVRCGQGNGIPAMGEEVVIKSSVGEYLTLCEVEVMTPKRKSSSATASATAFSAHTSGTWNTPAGRTPSTMRSPTPRPYRKTERKTTEVMTSSQYERRTTSPDDDLPIHYTSSLGLSTTRGTTEYGSTEDTITSSEETITSTEETITPSEETITSSEETITSSEETITSSEETITPSEETITSTEETITTSEETITPTDQYSSPRRTNHGGTINCVFPFSSTTGHPSWHPTPSDSTTTAEHPTPSDSYSTTTAEHPTPSDSTTEVEVTDFTSEKEGSKYTLVYMGCWKDTANRAIPTLEGSDGWLDGDWWERSDPINKCAEAALDRGFSPIGVQAGGWCASSAYAWSTYKKYGPAPESCCNTRGPGRGGDWCNAVYGIVIRDDTTDYVSEDATTDYDSEDAITDYDSEDAITDYEVVTVDWDTSSDDRGSITDVTAALDFTKGKETDFSEEAYISNGAYTDSDGYFSDDYFSDGYFSDEGTPSDMVTADVTTTNGIVTEWGIPENNEIPFRIATDLTDNDYEMDMEILKAEAAFQEIWGWEDDDQYQLYDHEDVVVN